MIDGSSPDCVTIDLSTEEHNAEPSPEEESIKPPLRQDGGHEGESDWRSRSADNSSTRGGGEEGGHADSLAQSHRYVMEIVDRHVFVETDSDDNASPALPQGAGEAETTAVTVAAICDKAFVDAAGRDLFLQILDEKRGRNAVLGERSFEAMAVAMKVSLLFVVQLLKDNFPARLSVRVSPYMMCAILGVPRQVLPE